MLSNIAQLQKRVSWTNGKFRLGDPGARQGWREERLDKHQGKIHSSWKTGINVSFPTQNILQKKGGGQGRARKITPISGNKSLSLARPRE